MSAQLAKQNNTSTKYDANSIRPNDSSTVSTMLDLSDVYVGENLEMENIDSIESPTAETEENSSNTTTEESNHILEFDQLESIINGSIGQLTELTPMIIDQEFQSGSVSLSASETPSSYAPPNVAVVQPSRQSPSTANKETIGDLDAERSWNINGGCQHTLEQRQLKGSAFSKFGLKFYLSKIVPNIFYTDNFH